MDKKTTLCILRSSQVSNHLFHPESRNSFFNLKKTFDFFLSPILITQELSSFNIYRGQRFLSCQTEQFICLMHIRYLIIFLFKLTKLQTFSDQNLIYRTGFMKTFFCCSARHTDMYDVVLFFCRLLLCANELPDKNRYVSNREPESHT